MNVLPDRLPGLPAILALLCLLAGCANLETLRPGEDRPADFNALLESRQYERAEQLLNEFPYLDSAGQRERLHGLITDYEDSVLQEARSLAREDNLIGAIRSLDTALDNLPHSTALNNYRRTLEKDRDLRLKRSERKQLLSRAEYVVEQQEIYREQLNLESPGISDRWTNSMHHYAAAGLAGQLLTCGLETMDEGDLETSLNCLRLARAIEDSSEVEVAFQMLEARLVARRDTQEKQAQITRVRQQKILAISRKNRTGELLVLTQKALEADDLPLARAIFEKIPEGERGNPPVIAMQERLESAIAPRVAELLKVGDRQYRADRVDRAIGSWQQALELDPGNEEIRERLDRANRVLARLEELKRQQAQ